MSLLSFLRRPRLAACVLASVTLWACGDDPAPATKADQGPSSAKVDAGSAKKDAGNSPQKDAGTVIPQGEPGDECEGSARAQCTGCDAEPCFVTCQDDGTYGDCVSLVGAIKDGGIKLPPIVTDAGEFSASDGQVSIKVGDASVVIPPMACPAPLVCSSSAMALSGALISSLAGGAAACINNDAVGFPPACSTAAECTAAGLKLSQCVMGYCIQICK